MVLRSARRDADPRRPRPSVVGRPGRRRWPACARSDARSGSPAVAVGALPYDATASAHLVVPEHVERAGALGAVLTAEQAHAPVTGVARPVPEPARYEAMVAEALARMAAGPLEKVVLARTLEVIADRPVDTVPMLRALARRDPRLYLFAVDLPARTDRHTADAARREPRAAARPRRTPRDGRTRWPAPPPGRPIPPRTAAAARPCSPRRRTGTSTPSSSTTSSSACAPSSATSRCPTAPSLVATATLWHLSTTLRARVADTDVSALHLAQALHPTPAVCGVPRADAAAAIDEIEPFDRGFYTGTVGWTDARGDGEWVMALRCGEVEGDRVRLWAGAGIVPASSPPDELAETTVKLRTLLDALGLDEG